MATTAPDSTTLFNLHAACADDNAIRAMVATSASKNLRVAADHVLAGATVSKFVAGAMGTEVLISWEHVEFAILHVADILGLSDLKTNWMLRSEFMSQVMMDLKTKGGLARMASTATEGEVMAAILKASKSMPLIKVTRADVLELDALSTGTWLDEATTAGFTSTDGKGRSYAQMRSALGYWRTPADADRVKGVLMQLCRSLSVSDAARTQ